MDSLITAAARSLATGDPIGALKRVALRDDPAYIALDNISLTQNGGGTVPEPSSFLLMGSGVLGLAGVIRRKMRG